MKKIAGVLLVVLSLTNFAFADSYALEVEGLKCQYCANRLERELQALEGVESVIFDLKAKQVELALADGHSLQQEQLRKTIQDVGFTLVKVDQINKTAQSDNP